MIFTRSKKVQKEYNKVRATISSDSCFICDRELIECEFEHWVLLRNRFLYKQSKNHYLLCPKRHIQSKTDLTEKEWIEFTNLTLNRELVNFGFDFDYFGFNRKEDSSFKYHIHCQIIEFKWYYKIIDTITNLIYN